MNDERRTCRVCGRAFTWLGCVTVPQGNWREHWCGCPRPTPPTFFDTLPAEPEAKAEAQATQETAALQTLQRDIAALTSTLESLEHTRAELQCRLSDMQSTKAFHEGSEPRGPHQS